MFLRSLTLQEFRTITQQSWSFSAPTTIFVGPNAVGKTSVVEAIALLATGESFRANEVAEMIRFSAEIGRVQGQLSDSLKGESSETTQLEALLTRGQLQGRTVQSRLYSVNGIRRRKKDFIRQFVTVVFRPEDMRLVEGSPARRRQFLNTVLTATDPEYAQALSEYEAAYKRRNRLLVQVHAGEMPVNVLTFWTQLLVKHGSLLQEKRRQFLQFCHQVAFALPFSVEYLPSVISAERMLEHAAREVAAGHMLIGPQKDDFLVTLPFSPNTSPLDVALYGSRGQQRLAVLWLKLCELKYVWQTTQLQPILLLDDILSELDDENRGHVLSLLPEYQTVITSADERVLPDIQRLVVSEVVHLPYHASSS